MTNTLIIMLLCLGIFFLNSCKQDDIYEIDFSTFCELEIPKQHVKHGSTIIEPDVPVRIGYEFKGWYQNDTEYDFDQIVKNNITLTAKWEAKKLSINFYEDEYNIFKTDNIPYNSKITEPVAIPEKEGYKFVEWQLNGEKYDFNAIATDDMILTAEWTINEYIITFDSNEGSVVSNQTLNYNQLVLEPEQPVRENYKFVEWQLNGEKYDFNSPVRENITLTAKWEKNDYIPKWKLNANTNNWNGQNMIIKIMVDSLDMFDPFAENYSSFDKKTKQAHIREIEAAYNINIVYEQYKSNFGADRINEIKDCIGDEWSYDNSKNLETGREEGGVYIININSSWIKSLAHSSSIFQLDEQFNNKNDMIQSLITFKSNTYGYCSDYMEPNYFLYYNVDLIHELGLANPTELWFNGKWTWSNFRHYIEELYSKLDSDQRVFAINYTEFFVGLSSSMGNSLAPDLSNLKLFSETSYGTLNKIKSLYNCGYFYENEDFDIFAKSKAVFISSSNENNYNNKCLSLLEDSFTIGVVPFPTLDNNGGIPLVTTDSNSVDIIYGYDGYPLIDNDGNYIIGLDLSNSTYQLPYTSASCYAIPYFIETEKINLSIVKSILYDLIGGYNDMYLVEESEASTFNMKRMNTLKEQLYESVRFSVANSIQLDYIVSLTNGIAFTGTDQYNNSLYYAVDKIVKNENVEPEKILQSIKSYYIETVNNY